MIGKQQIVKQTELAYITQGVINLATKCENFSIVESANATCHAKIIYTVCHLCMVANLFLGSVAF